MLNVLRKHWPEYLMEAAGLGIFMISAGLFTVLLEYPGSPVRLAIPDTLVRRSLIGLAMGLTAIGIIYSPWGQQSGAHINPAVTLTFFRLRKIERWDAVFYALFQFIGGVAGLLLMTAFMKTFLADPAVKFVATVPGRQGAALAFLAEFLIAFGLMMLVLTSTNTQKLARFTGIFAGILVATYITLEAPVSGMSMNPARTFASAVPANLWTAFWLYLTAPPLGMLLAAEVYLRIKKVPNVICAKLHHQNDKRCIFRCGYKEEKFKQVTSKKSQLMNAQ